MTLSQRHTNAFIRVGAVLVLTVGALAPDALAQTRSDTGRHQPVPPPEQEEKKAADQDKVSGDSIRRWHIGASGGVIGGSDLFRVEVIDGPPVPWDPDTGGGFQSGRFTASLDRNVAFGLFAARDFGKIWTLRADMGYSRMDVAAEALVGQTGAVFLFDRMSVVNLGLGVEARLTQGASYPFAQASVLLSYLGPARAEDLEQTNLGGRLGLGYLHSFQKIWGLRFEARLTGTGFSVGDYVPQAETADQPVIDYGTENHLVFFEFLIGIQASM